MKTPKAMPLAETAILAIADIKSATEAFDRGDTDVFDVLDAIIVAVEAYQSAVQTRRDAA
jgi:hypothetical protein